MRHCTVQLFIFLIRIRAYLKSQLYYLELLASEISFHLDILIFEQNLLILFQIRLESKVTQLIGLRGR